MMKSTPPLLLALVLALPSVSLAANKETLQLQRDVMLLQDQVRTMQTQMNEQISTLRSLMEQALDRINQVNTSVTRVDSVVTERMEAQQKSMSAPLVNMGAKVDQMGTEFSQLREGVQDMSLRMGKLEQQLVDIKTAIATLNAPPPPPSDLSASSDFSTPSPSPPYSAPPSSMPLSRPSPTAPGPSSASSSAAPWSPSKGASSPPAGVSAQTLYDNALRDKSAGRFDLAAQQFRDYLSWFGDTELAANARFYMGEIEFNKGSYSQALPHFDAVLERYQENNKTEDSFYMKGMSLVKMGERTRGAEEFYELLRRYPSGRLAPKAKSQLRTLGLSTVPPSRTTSR